MKIKFKEDKFYDGKLVYEKDKVYDIPEEKGQAERWLRRGGEQVEGEKSKKGQKEDKSILDSVKEVVSDVKESVSEVIHPEEHKESEEKPHKHGVFKKQ